ncbi:MAG TPA: hypothetical protein VFT49_03760 [Candidatus Saccharimonadales bacterium]|nr:hypothetical protein [Candidatus Saccharimonadales bacterium]
MSDYERTAAPDPELEEGLRIAEEIIQENVGQIYHNDPSKLAGELDQVIRGEHGEGFIIEDEGELRSLSVGKDQTTIRDETGPETQFYNVPSVSLSSLVHQITHDSQESRKPGFNELQAVSENEKPLEAVRVDNRVTWVNPDFNHPFNLHVDEPTPLGVMVKPHISDLEKDTTVLGLFNHRRSVLLERVQFTDKQGVVYRDIDSKGSGFVLPVDGVLKGHGTNTWEVTRGRGLLNLDKAERDLQNGEAFYKAGIRTVRTLAIVELNELLDDEGNKITPNEAKSRGLIDDRFSPVLELRAFGTRARMRDLLFDSDGEGLIKDAISLVAAEIGVEPDEFSPEDYLIWFAKTLGENMRKIHELGYVHGSLHEGNVTLDCRLVDFDGVRSLSGGDDDTKAKYFYAESKASHIVWDALRESVATAFPNIGSSYAKTGVKDELHESIENAFEQGYGGGRDQLLDRYIYGEDWND